MHINLQPTFYNRYSKPAFTSCMRSYDNDYTNIITGSQVYTTTSLFRRDLNFGELADYMIKTFDDKKKVNIKCLAGSDGSEAYSLAIALKERLTKPEQEKFFPILSLDKDKTILKTALTGKINLSPVDIDILKKEVHSNTEYFTNPQDSIKITNDLSDPDHNKAYDVAPELIKAVDFKLGDLLEEVENLEDDGNTVIMCRNVTPYLHPSQVSTLAYNLNKNLKDGSLCVIGNFDKNSNIVKYLLYYDFVEIMPNVFQKVTSWWDKY